MNLSNFFCKTCRQLDSVESNKKILGNILNYPDCPDCGRLLIENINLKKADGKEKYQINSYADIKELKRKELR